MKLHLNAVPVIVTAVFLLSMVGLRESAFRVTYTAPVLNMPADSVAFPGAEGWGAPTLTGCNRDSVYVHKLTPAQLDSVLANEMHTDTLDILIFTAGGWNSSISFTGSLNCVYIAGQTAPGGGVGIENRWRQLNLSNTRNLVIRGLTQVQRGRNSSTSTPHNQLLDAQYVIIAESDYFFSAVYPWFFGSATGSSDTLRYVSVMRNLFAMSQYTTPLGIQQTDGNAGVSFGGYVSYGRNMWHTNSHRNPNITGDLPRAKPDPLPKARIVGDFAYNLDHGHVQIVRQSVDIVDTYNKPGPNTQIGTPDYSWIVSINDAPTDTSTSVYVERLIGRHNRDTLATADSLWVDGGGHQEVACFYNNCDPVNGGGDPRDSIGAFIKRDTAQTLPAFPLSRINPFNLQAQLAGTASDSGAVGNYRYIQCDGTWAMRSDSLHAQLLKQVRDSTGVGSGTVDSAYVAARLPWTKNAGVACDDTDGDGMPNAYEDRMSDLDKNDATDKTSDSDLDGWTAIEEYVNGTSSDTYTASDGTEGGGASGNTYANLRNVYLLTFALDTTDEGRIVRIPNADSLAQLAQGFRVYALPSKLQGLVLTCDTISGWTVVDSAVVADSLAAWGISPSPTLRSVGLPGC